MKNNQLYPKTIEELIFKLNFIIENEQNDERIVKNLNWIEWYKNLDYKFSYSCSNNEFLMAFSDGNKYALQVWNHSDDVDSFVINLVSNHYSEYNTDDTVVIMSD